MKSIRSFLFPIILIAGFFIIINPVSAETVIWHAPEEKVATSTVWKTGEVHVISGGSSFYVNPDVTLTVEPGVVIKVGYNGIIRVYGNFVASGTKDNLIRIVSLRDDTVGGDTNSDGSATIASYNDWRGIQAEGYRYNSIVNIGFGYVEIKHAGLGMPLYLSKADSVKVENCNIVDNKNGIFIDSASRNVSINHSNIYNPNFCNYSSSTDSCHWDSGVKSFSGQAIDLTDNYWGSAEGPTYTTGASPTEFKGVILANLWGANIAYIPYAAEPFEFGVDKRHPVILIPGILGSWPDAWSDDWLIDPILHTYDDLIDALRLAGYEEGKTLFTLPYDWQKSNIVTAGLLKEKIIAAKAACVPSDIYDCSKVDLIGHSMGGLVARQYISSSGYGDDVDQLIFIATPQKGAPFAYLTLQGGDIDQDIFKNQLAKMFFLGKAEIEGYKSDLFYDGVMYYIRERVLSISQLLPIYDYIRDKATGILRQYPDNCPVNSFLSNLNSSANLDELDAIKITNILADEGANTISALRVIDPWLYLLDGKWQYGIPENYNNILSDRGLELGDGDGMVPKVSNSEFKGKEDIIISNANHLSVVSLAQKDIIKELTGQVPENTFSSTFIDHLLIFQIFSPADFQVVAPDGKIIGRDMAALSVINETPNGYYSGFRSSSTPEMVVIANPLEGDYKINLIGTESGGGYRMSVTSADNSTSSASSYLGQILPGKQKEINLSYQADSSSVSALKPDITFASAVNDVNLIYESKLLTGKNAKKKIIQRYESIMHEIEKQNKSEDRQHHENDKWQEKKRQEIIEEFSELDEYLRKLLAHGVLKQQGYDIIKSNNDYLINNWQ